MVDNTVVEAESNPALYKLLTGALTELERGSSRLVVAAFAAKFLALEGVQPLVDTCVRCGSTEHLVGIQIHEGGVICRNCPPTGEPLSADAREAFSLVLAGRVRQVLDETSIPVAQELEALVSRLIEQHTERRLKSSAVLYQHLH
jgi:DNA repair protein RecO (recombination protein O)